MNRPLAIRIETEYEYNAVIADLAKMNFRPYQLGETFRKCFITIEDRYMQLTDGSKLISDNYHEVSFKEFIGGVAK